jgi:predicted MFS family arabinose efflux permease
MTKTRLIAWTVWMIGSIFYAYQYILRVMPNIMLKDIMQQFNIDAAIFGQFSGFYYIGYAAIHLPLGIMLDRYGPKNVMPLCILLTVVGLTPILFADYWVYPIIGRALIGMGSSAAILGLFKIIRLTFTEERFTRMLSLSVTIGLIGAIYGGEPVRYLCDTLGYKAVVELFAMLGLLLATVTYFIVPKMEKVEQTTTIAYDIRSVITNKKVIMCCLFAGLMVGPLEGFADVWGSEFLKQVYGLEKSSAASLPSMIFIGMCFGAPVISFIAEKTGRYLASIVGAGIIMAAGFSALIFWQLTHSAIVFNFVLIGVCCAYQILAIYQASTYVSEQVAGLTTAIANMIIMSFGYIFHTVIGLIVNTNGGASVSSALVSGVMFIPFTLAIGAVGFTFLLIQDSVLKKQSVH